MTEDKSLRAVIVSVLLLHKTLGYQPGFVLGVGLPLPLLGKHPIARLPCGEYTAPMSET